MRQGSRFSRQDVLDPTIVINYSAIEALRRGVAQFQAEKAERDRMGSGCGRPSAATESRPTRSPVGHPMDGFAVARGRRNPYVRCRSSLD